MDSPLGSAKMNKNNQKSNEFSSEPFPHSQLRLAEQPFLTYLLSYSARVEGPLVPFSAFVSNILSLKFLLDSSKGFKPSSNLNR